jgi:hypothetical protein
MNTVFISITIATIVLFGYPAFMLIDWSLGRLFGSHESLSEYLQNA